MFAVSSTGEVERLADVFNEYNLSFRIGSRTPKPGSEVYVDESTYFAEDMAATVIVKAYVPEGMVLPEANLVLLARAICSTKRKSRRAVRSGRNPRSRPFSLTSAISPSATTLSTSSTHRPVPGSEGNSARRWRDRRVHDPGVRRSRAPLCAAHPS